jgi:hypothetical protein
MLIARQASASMQGLYNTGSVARTNWLGVMNYSGTATVFNSVQTISVGDYVYSVGNKTVGGISTGVIIKFSTNGTTVWEKIISLSGVNVRLNCITSDTDGNIYVGGYSGSSVATWIKFDNTGALLWSKSTTTTVQISQIHYLADRDCIITCNTSNPSISTFYIVDKTTGSVLDGRNAGAGLLNSTNNINKMFSVPGSNQIHMIGSWNSTSGSYPRPFYQKIDIGTGAFGTRTALYLNSTVSTSLRDVVLSNIVGNTFYACGNTREGGATQDKPFVLKMNTSGSVTWQKRMTTGATGASILYNITNDASDNLINLGVDNTSTRLMMSGINGLGVTNFTNLLDTPYNEGASGIHNFTNRFIFTSRQSTVNTILLGALPNNGSIPGTGSYSVDSQSITYNSTGSTLVDTSLTSVALTSMAMTIVTPSVSTPTYTVTAGTDTLTTVSI